jgi:hypothetical protein
MVGERRSSERSEARGMRIRDIEMSKEFKKSKIVVHVTAIRPTLGGIDKN